MNWRDHITSALQYSGDEHTRWWRLAPVGVVALLEGPV